MRLLSTQSDSQYSVFSEGVDEYAVNKFLSQIFSNDRNLHGKICSLVKESASRKFDMKEEVFFLYCCYINVLNSALVALIDLLDTFLPPFFCKLVNLYYPLPNVHGWPGFLLAPFHNFLSVIVSLQIVLIGKLKIYASKLFVDPNV